MHRKTEQRREQRGGGRNENTNTQTKSHIHTHREHVGVGLYLSLIPSGRGTIDADRTASTYASVHLHEGCVAFLLVSEPNESIAFAMTGDRIDHDAYLTHTPISGTKKLLQKRSEMHSTPANTHSRTTTSNHQIHTHRHTQHTLLHAYAHTYAHTTGKYLVVRMSLE
jgi:hypothetical protein